MANASASSGSAKQNTTTSLWSRRMEYVSGAADRRPAAQNITSPFTGSRTFSAGSSSFRLDPKLLDDRPPILGVGLYQCAESLRRLLLTRENLDREIDDLRLDRSIS
jgi:hypothetical protein